MKIALASIGLSALLAATPFAVDAATSLRGVMHVWRAEARKTHDMLAGRTGFDEGAIRAALQTYVEDAGRLGARVNGRSAPAQDFRRRLLGFAADARTALNHVGQRPVLKADFSRLLSDCQSCHNRFN